jgi:hypothetical protein
VEDEDDDGSQSDGYEKSQSDLFSLGLKEVQTRITNALKSNPQNTEVILL